ncbi:MAG: sigma-70 family RNA polymerase sigma factor [Anaerolineales bacterium]|nr:sigma-70 family RNA polymerase sigma factor [Anaerolineales bacterium]
MPDSEIELIQRAQNGESKAVGELYMQHHAQIFRYVWSKVGDANLAEDLTGDVFMRMVARLSTYQPSGVPFQAWLYRIARNLIIDHIRKSASNQAVPLDDMALLQEPGPPASSMVETKLTADALQKALAKIEHEQAEVIRLRFLAGLQINEVAVRLQKTPAAVKALQHRGLAALRVVMQT